LSKKGTTSIYKVVVAAQTSQINNYLHFLVVLLCGSLLSFICAFLLEIFLVLFVVFNNSVSSWRNDVLDDLVFFVTNSFGAHGVSS